MNKLSVFHKLKNDKNIVEVLKKGSIALFLRILGFICGYFFMYLTVKLFGVETQGRLTLAISFMIIGALFSRLGVDVHFVKVFAINGNFDSARGIYFKTFPPIAILATLLSAIIFVFSDFISSYFFDDVKLGPFLKWTAPCILFYTFILINAAVFRGLKKNTLYSFLFNGGRFMFALSILGIFVFFTSNPAIYVAIAHTVSVFILFFISFYYIFKYVFPIEKKSPYKGKKFILDSLPMLFSASMIVFLGWSDSIILGIFKDSATVGIYSVVLKIAVVTSFTFQALDSILAPKLSHAYHSNDMKSFKMLVKYSTRLNFIISIIVVALIIIFKDLILSIFGEEFRQASTALIILCIGQLFNAVCGPIGSIFQMTGYQKVFQNILFLALIINIALNLILVVKFGINGVSVATAISLAFWNLLGYIYIRKYILKT